MYHLEAGLHHAGTDPHAGPDAYPIEQAVI